MLKKAYRIIRLLLAAIMHTEGRPVSCYFRLLIHTIVIMKIEKHLEATHTSVKRTRFI